MKRKKHSLLETMLLALIPYSKQNLKLAFRPKQFFKDLESSKNYKISSIETTYYRAKRNGLIIEDNNKVRLSQKAQERVKTLNSTKLEGDVYLMIIFDIPEKFRSKRDRFRDYLKSLEFTQTQKSVWINKLDYRKQVIEAISELKLSPYVLFFECARLNLTDQ